MLPNTVRLKVVVVGDEGVGKARMLTTYISNSIPEYVPVQSDNDNITVRIGENKTIVLFLCDTSGQQDYDRLRPLSYPGTDIFLVLFSIHNKESFENLRTKWIPEVKHHCSNAHLILIGTNNSSNDDIERQVSDEEINEIQENYGILIYKYCNLFDLESVKSTFKKIVNICAEQVSLTFRLKNFKISTTKTEEILKFVEINNYNDLIKICGEYDKVKYSKLKLFSKSYKDIYLAYEIIIKFFTMHAIKICSNNCLDTNNYSIKINSNESAVIYFNILLNILKEFYNKFGGNKFEINQNILSKFIIDKITKYQNLMKQIFQESFEVELLDYLINDQSYERLPSFIEIKKKKQNDESENSIIDLFEKPYMFNDRYVIIELLGEGGYGIVFKAFDIEKYVWVALKVVTTFESLNGFEREIDVVTKLGKHLNIIEYLDYGYFQFNNTSIPFIVMELCDYSLNDKLLDNNNEFILIDKLSELLIKYSWVPVLAWGVLNILISLIGMIIYGVYTELRGPIVLQNQFLGVWLCSMLFFFSIQTIYYSLKPKDRIPKHISFILNVIYFTTVTLESFILFIAYAIGEMRKDAIAWTFLILITNILNVVIIVIKLVRQKRELNDTEDENHYISMNPTVKTKGKVPYIIFIVINTLLKCLIFIFMALLINGGVTLANRLRFPPRGNFVTVPLSGGRTQSIHYLCDGPRNNSFPVFLIEGDFSHGMADYYGIQIALKELGHRSCIWDKPGLGYSDYLYADQYDESSFYHSFITSIGETGPFIFVG
ncbi:hypothetical protein ABK040_001899 [Willaertia magna]